MPKYPRFQLDVMESLCEQVRYAPGSTVWRQMLAAEELLVDISARENYPWQFLVYRLTGYRSDSTEDQPDICDGRAVIEDVANFILRLSSRITVAPVEDRLGGTAVSIEKCAARWNVSVRSINRYRKAGLVCHHVQGQGGIDDRYLGIFPRARSRFRQRMPEHVKRAAGYRRMGSDEQEAVLDDARKIAAEPGTTGISILSQRLGQRHGRSPETIRNLLRQRDQEGGTARYGTTRMLTRRMVALVDRAMMRGIRVQDIATRIGHDPDSVRRVHRAERGVRLASLGETVVSPVEKGEHIDGYAVLAHASVQAHNLEEQRSQDALQIMEEAGRQVFIAEDSARLLMAYAGLRIRFVKGVRALGRWPGENEVDSLERDMRWLIQIRRRLIVMSLPHALLRIDQHLGRPLRGSSPDTIRKMITLGTRVSAHVVEMCDPLIGQHLEGLLTLHMDRAMPPMPVSTRRASSRHRLGTVVVNGFQDALCPWIPGITFSNRALSCVGGLAPSSRHLLLILQGCCGAPPCTLSDYAGVSGIAIPVASRRRREAMHALWIASAQGE